jgi:hypothetical protein
MIVPGGGLSEDGSRWIACRPKFFLPVRVLSRLFRRLLLTTLHPHEFIRRFLMHVLPKGFHRIRHYGLLANGNRAANVARARELLGMAPPEPAPTLNLGLQAVVKTPSPLTLRSCQSRYQSEPQQIPTTAIALFRSVVAAPRVPV